MSRMERTLRPSRATFEGTADLGGRSKKARGRLRLGVGMRVEREWRRGDKWTFGSRVRRGVMWYSPTTRSRMSEGMGTV